MKRTLLLMLFVLPVLFAGCCCTGRKVSAEDEAVKMIHGNRAECVIVKNGRIAVVERGRGVSPLLKIYDNHRAEMQDSAVVDKVIGRAAAFIVIAGKSKSVYGKIMSEDAMELLKKHNIKYSCGLRVPRILNNKRDGLCPLEDSVLGIEDPQLALKAMRKRIAELRKKK